MTISLMVAGKVLIKIKRKGNQWYKGRKLLSSISNEVSAMTFAAKTAEDLNIKSYIILRQED